MIRVTTLYASTAKYYTRYLTDAPGELPGQWAGQQAGLLGLNGTLTIEALGRLLSGHDPISDVELGFPLKDPTLANGKTIRAVAGFDATVSAPKSLSVLWAITGDPGFAEAHDAAVRFWPGAAADPGETLGDGLATPSEWVHEREWRVLGDFQFSWDEIAFLVVPHPGWQDFYASFVAGLGGAGYGAVFAAIPSVVLGADGTVIVDQAGLWS
ncbi:MAG: traI protein helicase [Schumannella sp.]|nr:traI protein helicase [Schumannella sp.]